MPSYNGNITLYTETVFPGDDLVGKVTYTASRACVLRDVELHLVCTALYRQDGKKKYKHDQPPITIHLLHVDEKTGIQREETLTESTRRTVFKFRTSLPSDLLPSTHGRCREILDVSYTLKLSSKKGRIFRRRETDDFTPLTVVPKLDLRSPTFSEMAHEEIKAQDMRFGQGFDILASASIPRQGWEAFQSVPVRLSVSRISDTNPHTICAFLERTIAYRNKTTITDVVQSRTIRLPDEPGPYRLPVVIPDDTPVSGVMFCPTLSIHYRLRVEIKCAVNSNPTFILGLPLVIGTKQQLLARPRSAAEGGSKEDLLRGPEPESRSYSSHPSHEARSDYSSFDRHLSHSTSGRPQPRSGDSGGHRSERPMMPSSVGTSTSGGQSYLQAMAAERQQQPSARQDRHGLCSVSGRQEMACSVDRGYTSAGTQTSTSVDTQTSPLTSYRSERSQQSSQHPPASSALSQSGLHVVNPSSCTTRSSSGAVSSTSPQHSRSSLSLESSGPQAMGPAGYSDLPPPPSQHSSSATHGKQAASTAPREMPQNWQSSLRRYKYSQAASTSPPNPSLPPLSQYGVLGHDPRTEVKRPVTPQPAAAANRHWSHEVDTSDREPLCPPPGAAAKKAKKRRNSRSLAGDSC